jgi:CRISPR/Cas system-associated exonuclease Cas4 (RecB family)
MTALADADNKTEEERFPKVERRDVCRQCSFFKVCKPNIPNL